MQSDCIVDRRLEGAVALAQEDRDTAGRGDGEVDLAIAVEVPRRRDRGSGRDAGDGAQRGKGPPGGRLHRLHDCIRRARLAVWFVAVICSQLVAPGREHGRGK